MSNMDYHALLAHQRAQLQRLCPPFDAAGFGGASEERRDLLSDIDCFLLAPGHQLSALIDLLPSLLDHPAEPILHWDRGWHAGFGYQHTFVYPGGSMVDYFVNSAHTLASTAMARKTRLVVDRTGDYTTFLAKLVSSHAVPADRQHAAAWAEVTVELLRVATP